MGNIWPSQVPISVDGDDTIISPDPVQKNDSLVVLCDYPPADVSVPLFRTGEQLRLLAEEGYRWKVCSIRTGMENYIPNQHVAKVYHGWLFEGVARPKAEELLRLPGNRIGSFMIRESKRGVYSLSVRHRSIVHYRIFRLPNNWYYIAPRLTFQCLEDLVNYYSDCADGLCCLLTAPCLAVTNSNLNLASIPPPVMMRNNFDWKDVNSSELMDQPSCYTSNMESKISFGLRHSVLSYMSLAGTEEVTKNSAWGRKTRSSVCVARQRGSGTGTPPDEEEEEDEWVYTEPSS
ncbi:src-like-adapter [Esox lucius]|uniref:SH2 domain-containing protein n=1 Tax=Esox lucius TaxID=8010 RepID=A0AAY5L3B2_ESOLU|nr:src-like-adapter [Esox lucius]